MKLIGLIIAIPFFAIAALLMIIGVSMAGVGHSIFTIASVALKD